MTGWPQTDASLELDVTGECPFVARCKFADCTHTHESGCGVKHAVLRNLIAPLRYESYIRIISGDAA